VSLLSGDFNGACLHYFNKIIIQHRFYKYRNKKSELFDPIKIMGSP
jgi:hypothetical protein